MQRLELVRLAESDDLEVESIDNAVDETADTEERPVPLAEQRRAAILAALTAASTAACSTWAAARVSWCRHC